MKNRFLFLPILAIFAATEARPQSPPGIAWLNTGTPQNLSMVSYAVIKENAQQTTQNNTATFTNNPPDAMGFIAPGLAPLSEMDGKKALALAFVGNPAAYSYFNQGIPLDLIKRELALTLMRNRGKTEPPTDEQIKQAILEMSVGDAPANFAAVYEVAMVEKSTGRVFYGSRAPYPGEKFLYYKGEPILSLTCLNFTPKKTSVAVTPGPNVQRTAWDEYIALGTGGGQSGTPNVNINTITLPANYTGQQQQQQLGSGCNHGCNHGCSNNQSREVVVKSKANAWDVIAGVTGIVNVGLNLWDILDDRRSFRTMGVQNFNNGFGGFINPNPPIYQNPNTLFQGGLTNGPGGYSVNYGSGNYGSYVSPNYTPVGGWSNNGGVINSGGNTWEGY